MEVGGQLYAPVALFPVKKPSPTGTRWIRFWVGTRASLDAVAKRKIPSPCRQSNPDHPTYNLVAILTALFRLLTRP